ncbi:Permease of the major facilitator superfamily,AmpG-like protein [Candidatus Glomeribacter gigasporarum BEG34]|uniref:Permease of the major facilitator superfamily,AmpG-like protein n=1 Tax=Candidatus Glomeribacter gigasporarum BEG34 TaxID=1070319 RepID=G2JBE2_9BURK|nr:MFS transporter [Candidatus Glomeribacter gigasporarum]CCD30096.1 Permease of the major facilitator superfamily,AmpG-like protein [Candidatus Glomeribacter gigasporarum BEG34]
MEIDGGRSRSPSRSDGGDPAASSYGEREATQCKPLKNALGRRRGWMLLMQILVCGSIAALGFIPPRQSIWSVAALATALAFFSASLDIVIDAYRRELLKDHEQGLGTAIHVNAYKLSSLIPGALSLILADHLPWSAVFVITAACLLPGMLMTFLIREPTLAGAPPKTLGEAVVMPFREFIARCGWRRALLVLAFICLYKLGDNMATALSTSFYLDLGFSKTQIGIVAKTSGLWTGVVGGLLGGVLLSRMGIARGLWVFGITQILSTLGFAWLARAGPVLSGLALAHGLEYFTIGLGTAAFTAYIASTTDRRYTATQFALFTSLAAVPRTFINASAGYFVEMMGWFNFFLFCAALGIPGMVLLRWVVNGRSSEAADAAAGQAESI